MKDEKIWSGTNTGGCWVRVPQFGGHTGGGTGGLVLRHTLTTADWKGEVLTPVGVTKHPSGVCGCRPSKPVCIVVSAALLWHPRSPTVRYMLCCFPEQSPRHWSNKSRGGMRYWRGPGRCGHRPGVNVAGRAPTMESLNLTRDTHNKAGCAESRVRGRSSME